MQEMAVDLRYRPFREAKLVNGRDWLELETVGEMAKAFLPKRIKLLVLYGSLRERLGIYDGFLKTDADF